MKVLLVDDEQAILEVFKQALEQNQDFQVVTALTGNEGLQAAKRERPDIIFLDQVLSDMNGNHVLELLKADPETKNIPVAILSNFNQDTLVESAMKIGASDYILKYQIAPADLVEKVKSLLAEAHASPSAQPTPPTPSVTPTVPEAKEEAN